MRRATGACLSAVIVAAACSEAGPTVDVHRADAGATDGTPSPVDSGRRADVVAVPVRDVGVDAGVDAGPILLDGSPTPPPAQPCTELGCPTLHGMPQVCVELPRGAGESPGCVADPRGRAYLARDFRLTGFLADVPEGDALEAAVDRLFNDSGYTLSLVFPRADANRPFSPLDFRAHLIQGAQPDEADTLREVPGGTSATPVRVMMDLAGEPAGEEPGPIWVMWPDGVFELTVPFSQAGAPCFLHTTTVGNAVAALVPAEGGHELVARLSTCLGSTNADFDYEGKTLRAILEGLSDPLCDTNGDAEPDGWPIQLDVRMRAVTFAGDPAPSEGAPFSPLCD